MPYRTLVDPREEMDEPWERSNRHDHPVTSPGPKENFHPMYTATKDRASRRLDHPQSTTVKSTKACEYGLP